MTTDISKPPSRPAFGGTALLLIVSFATIGVVAAEAAFMHWASWALLPVIMLVLILAAAGVVSVVVRLIDDGEIALTAPPQPAPETVAGTPEQRGVRPVLSH